VWRRYRQRDQLRCSSEGVQQNLMDVCVGVESAADSARKPREQTKKATKQYVPPVPRDYQLLMIDC
jgi:hypothetical protein